MSNIHFLCFFISFRPPLCKTLELCEAPNSPSVCLKVSYYHRHFYRQKLRTTEQGFPFLWDFFPSCI